MHPTANGWRVGFFFCGFWCIHICDYLRAAVELYVPNGSIEVMNLSSSSSDLHATAHKW